MINAFKATIIYKDFILGSIQRDFKIKYKSTSLGSLWLIIQPLSMVLVYTLIFSNVMKMKLSGNTGEYDYSIYLCSGLLTWGAFTEIVVRMKSMFRDNANIIKKTNFPKITLPIIITISSIINFTIIFSLFLTLLIYLDRFSFSMLLYFAPVFTLQIIFSISVGLIVSILNVFYRDVGQIVDILLQFLFWATPIVYVVSIMPETIKVAIMHNPMSKFIEAYHDIFVYGNIPNWSSLVSVAILSIALFILATIILNKAKNDIVDEL